MDLGVLKFSGIGNNNHNNTNNTWVDQVVIDEVSETNSGYNLQELDSFDSLTNDYEFIEREEVPDNLTATETNNNLNNLFTFENQDPTPLNTIPQTTNSIDHSNDPELSDIPPAMIELLEEATGKKPITSSGPLAFGNLWLPYTIEANIYHSSRGRILKKIGQKFEERTDERIKLEEQKAQEVSVFTSKTRDFVYD